MIPRHKQRVKTECSSIGETYDADKEEKLWAEEKGEMSAQVYASRTWAEVKAPEFGIKKLELKL